MGFVNQDNDSSEFYYQQQILQKAWDMIKNQQLSQRVNNSASNDNQFSYSGETFHVNGNQAIHHYLPRRTLIVFVCILCNFYADWMSQQIIDHQNKVIQFSVKSRQECNQLHEYFHTSLYLYNDVQNHEEQSTHLANIQEGFVDHDQIEQQSLQSLDNQSSVHDKSQEHQNNQNNQSTKWATKETSTSYSLDKKIYQSNQIQVYQRKSTPTNHNSNHDHQNINLQNPDLLNDLQIDEDLLCKNKERDLAKNDSNIDQSTMSDHQQSMDLPLQTRSKMHPSEASKLNEDIMTHQELLNEESTQYEQEQTQQQHLPILCLDINLGNGNYTRLDVFAGEEPRSVANDFAKLHNLTDNKREKLYNALKQQLASLLHVIAEEEEM